MKIGASCERLMDGYANMQIHQSRLPDYLKAADVSGFKVRVIAQPGEAFPYRPAEFAADRVLETMTAEEIGQQSLATVLKNNVGVSIIRPTDLSLERGYDPFWQALQRLDR